MPPSDQTVLPCAKPQSSQPIEHTHYQSYNIDTHTRSMCVFFSSNTHSHLPATTYSNVLHSRFPFLVGLVNVFQHTYDIMQGTFLLLGPNHACYAVKSLTPKPHLPICHPQSTKPTLWTFHAPTYGRKDTHTRMFSSCCAQTSQSCDFTSPLLASKIRYTTHMRHSRLGAINQTKNHVNNLQSD